MTGFKRLDDRAALNGILFVLHTGLSLHGFSVKTRGLESIARALASARLDGAPLVAAFRQRCVAAGAV
jgi:hypothetical protein